MCLTRRWAGGGWAGVAGDIDWGEVYNGDGSGAETLYANNQL